MHPRRPRKKGKRNSCQKSRKLCTENFVPVLIRVDDCDYTGVDGREQYCTSTAIGTGTDIDIFEPLSSDVRSVRLGQSFYGYRYQVTASLSFEPPVTNDPQV